MRTRAEGLNLPRSVRVVTLATQGDGVLGIMTQSLYSCHSPRVQCTIDEALHYWSMGK